MRAINWIPGDDAHNISELADIATENVLRGLPSLDFIEYDFEHGGFKDTHTGQPVVDSTFATLAKDPGARAAFAGSATLKRTVLMASVLSAVGRGGRDGFLATLARVADQHVLDPALWRIFYSRSADKAGTADDLLTS